MGLVSLQLKYPWSLRNGIKLVLRLVILDLVAISLTHQLVAILCFALVERPHFTGANSVTRLT